MQSQSDEHLEVMKNSSPTLSPESQQSRGFYLMKNLPQTAISNRLTIISVQSPYK